MLMVIQHIIRAMSKDGFYQPKDVDGQFSGKGD